MPPPRALAHFITRVLYGHARPSLTPDPTLVATKTFHINLLCFLTNGLPINAHLIISEWKNIIQLYEISFIIYIESIKL